MKNIHLPFTENNVTNQSYFVIDSGDINTINNNIVTLFSTPSGTRIRNADFGLLIYNYLNSPRNQRVLELIKRDITDKFSRYILDATLLKVEIEWNKDKTASVVGYWKAKYSNNQLEQKFTILIK